MSRSLPRGSSNLVKVIRSRGQLQRGCVGQRRNTRDNSRTNRWTRAAGACFASRPVRRCLNELAPPRQLRRSMPLNMKLPTFTFRLVLPIIYVVLAVLPAIGMIITIAEGPNPFAFLLFVSAPGFYFLDI